MLPSVASLLKMYLFPRLRDLETFSLKSMYNVRFYSATAHQSQSGRALTASEINQWNT